MKHIHVQEISPADAPGLRHFTVLERQLLGRYPLYVSNTDANVIHQLAGKSAFTREMQIAPFIASEDNGDVARCAALISPCYQEARREPVGSIGYFAAAPESEEAVQVMLGCAEEWLQARGVTRIIAPFNGSPLVGFGLLTAAFDEEAVMNFSWNPPYYAAYLTQAGYRPTYPMLVYTTDFAAPQYRAEVKRAEAVRDFTIRPIDKKRWDADLDIMRELVNETFVDEWEWSPATLEQFKEIFDPLKPVYHPGLLLIAEMHGKPVGAAIAIPNWNPLMRSFKGKLGLPQMLRFLLRGMRYPGGGHAFAAVRPEGRGRGMGRMLVASVCRTYEKLGLKKAYGYTINIDNQASQKMNEALGGVGRILYHAYDKVIG